SSKSASEIEALKNQLKQERTAKASAYEAAQEATARAQQYADRAAQLEAQLKKGAPAAAAGGGASSAEAEKLKADLAALKKKLVPAESAMEVAATLKAKVAKLEAQLKAKG